MQKNDNKKIRVAFIKFGGLAAGGTEKFLQSVAANLPKEKFDITYFYCDAAPYIGSDWKHPDTDQTRIEYMNKHKVKLVKFDVKFKDVTKPTHDWVGTTLWDVFNEDDFDIVTSARSGHPEYPFTHIRRTPIVDTIHLSGMVDNQSNVEAVIHLSEWNKNVWVKGGGRADRAHVIYIPIKIPESLPQHDYRKELGLETKFVFGMHQRADDGIFSPIPLSAYQKVETDNTAFVILGGSKKYQHQAEMLGLKNFIQLDPIGDFNKICRFLEMIDVYTHGRADGENNSQSIAEAMAFSCPIISHFARSNGHVETVGNAGKVVSNANEYAAEMKKLLADPAHKKDLEAKAKARFAEAYDLKTNIDKFVKIYEDVYANNRKVVASDDWLNEWADD